MHKISKFRLRSVLNKKCRRNENRLGNSLILSLIIRNIVNGNFKAFNSNRMRNIVGSEYMKDTLSWMDFH